MTVAELIQLLSEMPLDAEVRMDVRSRYAGPWPVEQMELHDGYDNGDGWDVTWVGLVDK